MASDPKLRLDRQEKQALSLIVQDLNQARFQRGLLEEQKSELDIQIEKTKADTKLCKDRYKLAVSKLAKERGIDMEKTVDGKVWAFDTEAGEFTLE